MCVFPRLFYKAKGYTFTLLAKNGDYLSGFKKVWLPDFKSQSKSRPFAIQRPLNHLKSRLVHISDPHFIWILIPTVLS